MKKIDWEILEILRKALNQETVDAVSDWQQIYAELKKQAVRCLPYSMLSKSDILTPEEKNSYMIDCMQVYAYHAKLIREQGKLTALLQESGIPVVVLKGYAAAMYYPNPLYREMGDIDLLVKPVDFERAYELMKANYVLTEKVEDMPRHAGFRTKSGIPIELHRYFSIQNKNKALDNLLYRSIDSCEMHQYLQTSFPTLPPMENGLVLLYHIYQHMKVSGIGYRQVIDYWEFLNSNRECISEFLELAETVQLRGIAEVMLYICRKYFGLQMDENLAAPCSPETEAYLMDLFAASGNLGNRSVETGENKISFVLRSMNNPIKGFRMLQKYGLENWEAARKHAVLRPFAWFYQLVRYLRHLKNYGGIRGTAKNFKRIYDKEQLFQDLGIQNS